jgi:succinate dehydrogenase flavin-adding protein (antitoxin of CptAB toxin-antitoxin module)
LGEEATLGKLGVVAGGRTVSGGTGSKEWSVPGPIEGAGPTTPVSALPVAAPRLSAPRLSGTPFPATPFLARLYRELGEDDTILDRFVRDYLNLLDERLSDIRRFLKTDDLEAAGVALMSLETTSAMLGAEAVLPAVARLRQVVAAGRTEEFSAHYATMLAALQALRAELVLGLLKRG